MDWLRRPFCIGLFVLGSLFPAAAGAETSHLDGLTLFILDTTDIASLHQAREFVQANGGRVGVMVPPSVMIGWADPVTAGRLVGKYGIKDIRWSETSLSSLPTNDDQSLSAVNSFNDLVSGRYERREMEAMASDAEAGFRAGSMANRKGDSLPRPDVNKNDVLANLNSAGLDGTVLSDVNGNSDRMTGTVAVTFFLVESDGSGADPNSWSWTPEAMQEYMDATVVGLLWWVNQATGHRDCWLTFLINHYSAFDTRCQTWVEPVLHDSGFVSTWSAIVLGKFGYVSGSHFARATAFNTWQVATYQTNWAYSAFIAYNPVGSPGQYADGGTATAWLYGPYFWSLYRIQGWTRDQPISHETGHIFGACDEYAGGCASCASSCSIYGTPNANCEVCNVDSRACMMRSNENGLCQYSKGMIGWDALTPCAPNPPAPLAAPTIASATNAECLQGGQATFTVTGTNYVAGVEADLGPGIFVHQTTRVNATTLTVWVSVFNDTPDGPIDIVVRNKDGQTATLVDGFAVLPTLKHYYSNGGSNVFPYLTPATAGSSLSDVIAAAADGDTVLIPTMTFNGFSLGLDRGVTLQGAWNPTFTTRNLASGKTVINLNGIIDIYPGSDGAGLDGFIIENGDGKLDIYPASGYYAGAVRILNSIASVRNCEIRNSTAGPGPQGAHGGAIYAYQSTVTITDNHIHDNVAALGGAIYLDQCGGTIASNEIAYNDVVSGGGPAPEGSGVYAKACTNLTLTNNFIHHNAGGQNGGGILAENSTGITVNGGTISYHTVSFGGGGVSFKTTQGVIQNAVIKRNSALLAGGISVSAAPQFALRDSRVEWNTGAFGGGASVDGPNIEITHNIFVGNSSNGFAGALTVSGATTGRVAGNTVDRNSVLSGVGGINLTNSPIEVFNNIVSNTTGAGIGASGSAPTLVAYNNVVNASGGAYSGVVGGAGSLAAAPVYVDTVLADYHLGSHSPCIDAGRTGAPYNDPDASRGDMGAYGAHAFTMAQPAFVQNALVSGTGGSGGTLALHWNASPEGDVVKYAVYGSASSGFAPALANFLGYVNAPATSYALGAAPAGGTTYYRVNAVDLTGYAGGYSVEASSTPATGTGPLVYENRLHGNTPNPFNPTTEIRFDLAGTSTVTLSVYDVNGRRVRTLVSGTRARGSHVARWDGTNDRGETVTSGIYFCRLDGSGFSQTMKMTLLK